MQRSNQHTNLVRLIILFTLMLLAWVSVASAEMFKWRDAQGRLHFTDSEANIPAEYRQQAEEHQPQSSFSTVESGSASIPAEADEPPGDDDGPQPAFSIPYRDREGSASRIIIDVTFNGRVTAPIMVDTGSPGLVMSSDLASRLGLFKRDGSRMLVTISGIGGSAVALRTIVDRLQIGKATEEFVPAHIVERMPPAYQGLIGMDVLSGYTLTIDPVNRRLVANVNPLADELPGGRGEHWWRSMFREFQYFSDYWEQQYQAVKSGDSAYRRLPGSDFNDVREFIEFQRNESATLLKKLERQAGWKQVPRHWRR